MIERFLATYDFNLPLQEALDDPALPIARRLLAGAAMDQGLDSAYYLTLELFEAFERLARDRREGTTEGDGAAKIEEILRAVGDDYQRRIYYLVSELDLDEAIGDLAWLVRTTRARASMFPVFREEGVMLPPIPGAAWVDTSGTP